MSLHDAPIYLKPESVQRIDVSGGSGNTAIREDLVGSGWFRLKAVGGDVQCYLTRSDSDAVTLDSTSAATSGWDLVDGQSEDFYSTGETRVAWASSGAGYLVLLKCNKGSGQ